MNARGPVRFVLAVAALLLVSSVNTAAAGGSAPLWSSAAASYHPVVAVAPEVRRATYTCLLCDAQGHYNPFAARGSASPVTAPPVVGHLHGYSPSNQYPVPEVKRPNYGYPVNSPLNGWSPWGAR